VNGHKLQSIRVQDVALVPHPSSDEPVVMYIGDEGQAIGCRVCGASKEEAMEEPCLGEEGVNEGLNALLSNDQG
jgi:hypothetical protein